MSVLNHSAFCVGFCCSIQILLLGLVSVWFLITLSFKDIFFLNNSLWEICLSLCNVSAIYQKSESSGFLTSCSL